MRKHRYSLVLRIRPLGRNTRSFIFRQAPQKNRYQAGCRLFTEVNKTLESRGLFGNVFTFIDASSIISKTALWEERDRAIADGAESNNKNVKDYAADKDARWGAKSKQISGSDTNATMQWICDTD